MKLVDPFLYPKTPLRRRHGPIGYSKYQHYRPWLRDEFDFRCVYCLKREQWVFQEGDFQLDHQVAQTIAPELCREYTNLVYACANCNARKGAKSLPAPEHMAYGASMEVLRDGRIIAHNALGQTLIDELALDGAKLTAKRFQYIRSIHSHQQHDWSLFLLWMGFPSNLPDLANVTPLPKGNLRPEGIAESWFCVARPEYYE